MSDNTTSRCFSLLPYKQLDNYTRRARFKKNDLMPDVAWTTVLVLVNLHVEYLFINTTERDECIIRDPAVDGHTVRKTLCKSKDTKDLQ